MPGEKEIIGQSSSLREVFSTLNKVAPSDTTVLVTGESGTGKELLVRALHKKALGMINLLSPSTVALSLRSCWSQNFLDTKKAPLPTPYAVGPGVLNLPMAGRFF